MTISDLTARCAALMALTLVGACATTSAPPPPPPPPPQMSAEAPANAAPTPVIPPTAKAAPDAAATTSLTPEEEQLALDQAFASSLGEFDERLAREQFALNEQRERAAAEAAARAAGGAAAGVGMDGMAGGAWPPTPNGNVERGGVEGGAPGAPSPPRQSAHRGGPGDRPSLPVPEDIDDGRNDDVVARQLREAAQYESDPELAARLWDEYREYKRKQR